MGNSTLIADYIYDTLGLRLTARDMANYGKINTIFHNNCTTSVACTSTTEIALTDYSITVYPQSTLSKFWIFATFAWYGNGNGSTWSLSNFIFYRDTTAIYNYDNFGIGNYEGPNNELKAMRASFQLLDTPRTTSAITYNVKTKNRDYTTIHNINTYGTGSFTVMEVYDD